MLATLLIRTILASDGMGRAHTFLVRHTPCNTGLRSDVATAVRSKAQCAASAFVASCSVQLPLRIRRPVMRRWRQRSVNGWQHGRASCSSPSRHHSARSSCATFHCRSSPATCSSGACTMRQLCRCIQRAIIMHRNCCSLFSCVLCDFCVCSVLVGPQALDMVTTTDLGHLQPITQFALAFISMSAGAELYLPELRALFRRIITIT